MTQARPLSSKIADNHPGWRKKETITVLLKQHLSGLRLSSESGAPGEIAFSVQNVQQVFVFYPEKACALAA